MRLIKPSFEIIRFYADDLRFIEEIGRTCYKSEDKITDDSAENFIKNKILKRGHESVIEHSALTVKFIVDRGVSHELVRHRLCAFSQESTRYCNYKGEVTFVIPPWVNIVPGKYSIDSVLQSSDKEKGDSTTQWFNTMQLLEAGYIALLEDGWTPQQARLVLPNSLKTEIVVTANFREWRHILSLRCSKAAHPQMREVMLPLLQKINETIPVIFEDIYNE